MVVVLVEKTLIDLVDAAGQEGKYNSVHILNICDIIFWAFYLDFPFIPVF